MKIILAILLAQFAGFVWVNTCIPHEIFDNSTVYGFIIGDNPEQAIVSHYSNVCTDRVHEEDVSVCECGFYHLHFDNSTNCEIVPGAEGVIFKPERSFIPRAE